MSYKFIEPPKYIWMKNSFDSEFKKTPIEAVSQRFGITWTEEVIIGSDDNPREKITKHVNVLNDDQFKCLITHILENRDKIGLLYMGEDVGYGVVARQDIPEEDIITTYAGCFQSQGPGVEEYSVDVLLGEEQKIGSISARNYRNFGGFFQHLPGKERCKNTHSSISIHDYTFDKEMDRGCVATANIYMVYAQHKGKFLYLCFASRAIKAGEILGYDYGRMYWEEHDKVPVLFTTLGRTLKPSYKFSGDLFIRFSLGGEGRVIIMQSKMMLQLKSGLFFVSDASGKRFFLSDGMWTREYKRRHPHAPYLKIEIEKPNYIAIDTDFTKIPILLFIENQRLMKTQVSRQYIESYCVNNGLFLNKDITIIISKEDFRKVYANWDGKSWLIFDRPSRVIEPSETLTSAPQVLLITSFAFASVDIKGIKDVLGDKYDYQGYVDDFVIPHQAREEGCEIVAKLTSCLAQRKLQLPEEKNHSMPSRPFFQKDPHTTLQKQIECILATHPGSSSDSFKKLITDKKYGSALRTACTNTNVEVACALVSALLEYREPLSIDINEVVKGFAAIHYAITKQSTPQVYQLLKENGADVGVINEGKTAQAMYQEKFGEKRPLIEKA